MASKSPLTLTRAKREKVKASIMIQGLSGSGKSGLALAIAQALSQDWSKVGCVDTENNSLLLYPGVTLNTGEKIPEESFCHVSLNEETGYAPTTYTAARDLLLDAGCEAVVFDSITHMWTRQDGVLDKVSQATAKGADNYRVWGQEDIAQEKNEIFELVRCNKCHIISTVRVKEKFAMELNEQTGKYGVSSKGEQQMQQDGLKYEPDLVLAMVKPGSKDTHPVVQVIKSRYPMFEVGEEIEVTPAILSELRSFLDEGADVEDLAARRRAEYEEAITTKCTDNPGLKVLWKNLVENSEYKGMKVKEIPLEGLKILYAQLVK